MEVQPSAPPVSASVGGAWAEMMELADDIQILLSADTFVSSDTLHRIKTNLERHAALLRDPLGLGKGKSGGSATVAASSNMQASASVSLWRQGRNVPFNGGNMTQKLQALELFVKGIRNPEQLELKRQGMTEQKARQILNDFSGKVDFVQKAHGVVMEQLGNLERALHEPRHVCQDLWVDAHKAIWNPNSEIRSKLERYFGQRLEAFLDVGGLGNMAQMVGWYWPDFSPGYGRGEPKMIDIRLYNKPQPHGDMDTYRYKLEVQLEMRLAKHMGFLRRKIALDIVKQLLSARAVYEDHETAHAEESAGESMGRFGGTLQREVINLIMTFTNELLCQRASSPTYLSQQDHLPKIDFPWKPEGLARNILVRMKDSLIDESVGANVDDIRASTAKEALVVSSHALLALFYHTQILPKELSLLANLIHSLQEIMYKSLNRDDRQNGDSSSVVIQKLTEHSLFDVTSLLLLVFISAVDPAENHKLLRRTLPGEQQPVDMQGRKLNDFTHARFGPSANFHPTICDFELEKFDIKVLFPFASDVQQDTSINPSLVPIHPRNSQPFSSIMHLAWRLMRAGSSASDSGGDPHHLAEQCRNLLGNRPFAFLKVLLQYPGFRHDGHRDLFCTIIFDFFAQFLNHLKQSRTKLDGSQFAYVTTRPKEERRIRKKSRQQDGWIRSPLADKRDVQRYQSGERTESRVEKQWEYMRHRNNRRNSSEKHGRDRMDSRFGERDWLSVDEAGNTSNFKDCLEDLIELVEVMCRTTPAIAQNFPLHNLGTSLPNHANAISAGGVSFALDGGTANPDQNENRVPLSSTFVFDVYEAIETEIFDDPDKSSHDVDLLLIPFIKMLEALSIDVSSAERVYKFLLHGREGKLNMVHSSQAKDTLCSWQSFLQFLDLFATQLQDDEGSSVFQNNSFNADYGGSSTLKGENSNTDPNQKLHRARLCKAIMQLCQTVFRNRSLADSLRSSSGTSSDDFVLTLFKLLPCPIPPDVKGEIMRTLAVLSKHTAETARAIWGLMEKIQIIKTENLLKTHGVASGNRTDLLTGNLQNHQIGYLPRQVGRTHASLLALNDANGGVDAVGSYARPSSGSDQVGIASELDKVERYNKKYDAQFGFLCMLAELMRTGVPTDLGTRRNYVPGAIPHLEHVTNRILLSFRSFQYTKEDPGEKWKLAAAALAVYFRTLVGYEIDFGNPDVMKDFESAAAFDQFGTGSEEEYEAANGKTRGNTRKKGEQAGFYVMKQLTTINSDVLKVILGILTEEDGVDSLMKEMDAYGHFHKANVWYGRGAVWHERAVLMALAVLRIALDREGAFMRALHTCNNYSLRVRKLSQTLLVHNFELLKIGCYVSYTRDSQICAHAVRIFHHVIQTVNSNDIAGVLLNCAGKDEHMLVRKLVAGFAMCLRSNNETASQAAAEILQLSATFTCEGELDSERAWWMDGNIRDAENMDGSDSLDDGHVGSGKEDDDTDDKFIEENIGENVRQMVAELLISGLEGPAPNVSHILLGVHNHIIKGASYSTIDHNNMTGDLAGNIGWSDSSCYRAIVDKVAQDYLTDSRRPRLASLAYRILYTLCRQPATSDFVMRNLRKCISLKASHKSTNFWFVHLRAALTKACDYKSLHRSGYEEDFANSGNNLVYEKKANRVMPWLIRGATLEIFRAARSTVPNRETIIQFMNLLYSDNASDELVAELARGETSRNDSHASSSSNQHRMRVIELLQWLDLSEFSFERREVELGGHGVPDRLIPVIVKFCSEPLLEGGYIINIPLLHQLYREELRNSSDGGFSVNDQARYRQFSVNMHAVNNGLGAGVGTESNFSEKEKRVLKWAMSWNRFSKRLHRRFKTVHALGALVQITISECSQLLVMPSRATQNGSKSGVGSSGVSASDSAGRAEIFFHTLIIEVLQSLTSNANVPTKLISPLVETASVLMYKLRMLKNIVRLSRKQCHDLLGGIIEAILRLQSHEANNYIGISPTGDEFSSSNSDSTERMKVHIYTLLLNYVRYSSNIMPQSEWIHLVFGDGLSGDAYSAQKWLNGRGLPLPPAHNQQSRAQYLAQLKGDKEILDKNCPHLLRIVLRDASAGATVKLRTTALNALDAIMSYDLKHSISAELLRDEGLIPCFQNVFASVDNNMSKTWIRADGIPSAEASTNKGRPETIAPKPEFVALLEATLSLFTRIALSQAGALMLVSSGIVEQMASCRAIRCPSMISIGHPNGMSGQNLWHRMIMPALRLVSVLLTTLQAPNRKLVEQTCIFLGSSVYREDYRTGAGAGVGAGGATGIAAEGLGARIPLINYILMIGGAGVTSEVLRQKINKQSSTLSGTPYAPLRSRMGGVMLPTLAAMRRVSVCVCILARCVTSPAGFDTLNKVVLQNSSQDDAGKIGNLNGGADELGGATGSIVGNIVRRVVDLLATYSMPPSLARQGPPANKIARLTRSLVNRNHFDTQARYSQQLPNSNTSDSVIPSNFRGLGVRPDSPVSFMGRGYDAKESWDASSTADSGLPSASMRNASGSCWFSSVRPESTAKDTSWSQTRLSSHMIPAAILELQQGMQMESWTLFDHLKWIAGKSIVEHASFLCSMYMHIDPHSPVTTQVRIGTTNTLGLLFSEPRGTGRGAGTNSDIFEMQSFGNSSGYVNVSQEKVNINVREGGAVGRGDFALQKRGTSSRSIRNVTAGGFLGSRGSGFTLDEIIYILEILAREALACLRCVEQIKMDLHVSEAQGHDNLSGAAQSASFRNTVDFAMQTANSKSSLKFAQHECNRALTTVEQILGIVCGHLDFFRAVDRNTSSTKESSWGGMNINESLPSQSRYYGGLGYEEAVQESVERVSIAINPIVSIVRQEQNPQSEYLVTIFQRIMNMRVIRNDN